MIVRNRPAEARASLGRAVARLEARRRAGPDLGAVRPVLGIAYRELAGVLDRAGERDAAAAARAKAADLGPGRPPGPSKGRQHTWVASGGA